MPRRSPNLDLNNWLDSHGYRHSHARKQALGPAVPASSKPCKCAEPWVTVERPTPCHVCGGDVEDDEEFPRQGHARKSARIIHQPPTGRPVFAAHERDHHITTSGRRALDREQFALPPGPEEKHRGIEGRLPIDTIARARNALQRASQMQKRGHITAGQLAEVQRAVHRAWPSIEVHALASIAKGGQNALRKMTKMTKRQRGT